MEDYNQHSFSQIYLAMEVNILIYMAGDTVEATMTETVSTIVYIFNETIFPD